LRRYRVVLRKTSLVDFPGTIAAALFFPLCNLRCPWCQNRELVLGGAEDSLIPLDGALSLIAKRRSLIGGVALSGGEPSLVEDLPLVIGEIRRMGFRIKLDTNGMAPAMLGKLLEGEAARPDYIAMDLKLAPRRYKELLPGASRKALPGTAPPFDPGAALGESAALLRASGVPHEFRSLALPGGFFGPGDLASLAPLAAGSPWYLRPFMPGNCLDPAWNSLPSPGEGELRRLGEIARSLGARISLPGKGVS
jgi:pyruvate formate lyase activating enzyme